MKLLTKTSKREVFVTKNYTQIAITESNNKVYTVSVRLPGMLPETIATDCTHKEALQIAREQYMN